MNFGAEPVHWLAWNARIRVQYPVQSLMGRASAVTTLVNDPIRLTLTAPFVGANLYPLAGASAATTTPVVRRCSAERPAGSSRG